MRKGSLWIDSSAVWAIIALGFLFLAADDLFRIHENFDNLIHYVFNMQETGLTDRIDDIIIGLYGFIGIGVLIAYRDELIIYKKNLPFFILGFVTLFIMVALDVLTNRNDILPLVFDRDKAVVLYVWLSLAEDSLKVMAEAFFILAFYAIFQKAKDMRDQGKRIKFPVITGS